MIDWYMQLTALQQGSLIHIAAAAVILPFLFWSHYKGYEAGYIRGAQYGANKKMSEIKNLRKKARGKSGKHKGGR